MMKKITKSSFYRRGIQLMLVGICTGLLAGVIVTFYNLAADFITAYSKDIYLGIRNNPGFIPLLFLVLAVSSFAVGTVIHFIPMIRGSGIPQTEGASRGLLHMKWYQVLPAMAATSLYCMFLGLTAGAEGPSMFIGGCSGDAVNSLTGGTDMERRYQITGGACAGLAVAFNAPLTGIIFAFEEAHRRFTPSIFICAFSSVLTALITRNALFELMDMEVTSAFVSFVFAKLPLKGYLYVAFSAVISGLFGVGFYKLGFLFRKLFARMTVLKGTLRMLVPFLFAGVVGLITVYAMGGGHALIEALGTRGGTVEMSVSGVFSSPVVVTVLIVLILRLIATTLNLGAGVPSGIFIPMLALGACMGALLSKLCGLMGMDAVYSDCIVMISMATFFTSVVKAPLTAIVMVVELTWQFTLLLPVILGVSIGYMISEIFRLEPLYDAMLDTFMQEGNVSLKRYSYATVIEKGALANGRAIRDVLWPGNLLIRSIRRDGAVIVPASDTVLQAGDEIAVQAENTSLENLQRCVDEIVKPNRNPVIEKFRSLTSRIKSKNAVEINETPETDVAENCVEQQNTDGVSPAKAEDVANGEDNNQS